MTATAFLLVALAGGLGASCRYLLDSTITRRAGEDARLPWGTIVVNTTGSFLLGLLTGLAAAQWLPPEWLQVVGVGFLGGYTTFSTASHETVRLLQEGRMRASLVNGFGILALTMVAAGLGLVLGSAQA